MKGVIFVCLLSLSVSFSLPSPQDAGAPIAPTIGAQAPVEAAKAAPAQPAQATTAVVQSPANETKVNTPTVTASNATAAANGSTPVPSTNATPATKNETIPTEKDNKTDTKSDKDAPKPIEDKTAAPQNKTEAVTVAPSAATANGTKPDNKKNEATTPKGEVVNPTVAPVEAKSRAFDGPSFIGGIILTLGLLAIGFMGFKYYKNQTERNYHTL